MHTNDPDMMRDLSLAQVRNHSGTSCSVSILLITHWRPKKSIASKVLVCLQAECQIMSQLMHKRFVSDFLGLLFFITTGTTRAVPIICFGSK